MFKAVAEAAPHRVGYWFATQGDLDVYWKNVYAAWRAAVRAAPWVSLSPYEMPIVPVFSGHVLDREFSAKAFGSRSVEGVLFGLRDEAMASRVAVALRQVRLAQTLGVTCPAPSPDDPRLSFPLTEFLCSNTVFRLNRDHADQSPGYDPDVGLHVAMPQDEEEEHALEMAVGQPEFLPPFIVRLLERTRAPAVDPARGASYVGLVPPVRKFQVFVSATFDDLQEERQAVFNEVMRARHIPVGMEVFTAAHDRGWGLIKHLIDTSDYYVVLVGGRYGTLDKSIGMSWTEREYRYARDERKLRVLPFLRKKGKITADKMDTGDDAVVLAAKLAEFSKLLKDNHHCHWWEDGKDLAGAVAQALRNQIEDDEREGALPPGWLRESGDADAVRRENDALRRENTALRATIEAGKPKPTSFQSRSTSRNGQPALDVIITGVERVSYEISVGSYADARYYFGSPRYGGAYMGVFEEKDGPRGIFRISIDSPANTPDRPFTVEFDNCSVQTATIRPWRPF